MKQVVEIKYVNFNLQIGMVNWREVYLLQPTVVKLLPEVDKGRLVYRAKGSARRFSYAKIKSSLVRTTYNITEELPDWL